MSKKSAVIAGLIVVTIFGIVAASGEEPKRSAADEIRLLKAEVKMLRSTVQPQRQEIEQLKAQLAEARKRQPTSRPSTQPAREAKNIPPEWIASFQLADTQRRQRVTRIEEQTAVVKEKISRIKKGEYDGGYFRQKKKGVPRRILEQRRDRIKQEKEKIADLNSKVSDLKASSVEPPIIKELTGGCVGRLPHSEGVQVKQIIDNNQMLASVLMKLVPQYRRVTRSRFLTRAPISGYDERRTLIWFKGIKTAGLVDDKAVEMDGLFIISGTKKYTTVAGSTKTVFVLEPVDEQRWRAACKAWKKLQNAKPPPAVKE